ncbi:hypothetical protein FDO65_14640 [Nakamurella flava]|uniref:PH domain-containing protein n=1 Tax=Nakamurella flava TaxID=2576308 RepID=A0A4U6QFI0_9ACTN|nr:hypothetical protein [Nakamurella flava]TKV58749.1 hypothetical protein FDO65_14640 [Nakamurella flava]
MGESSSDRQETGPAPRVVGQRWAGRHPVLARVAATFYVGYGVFQCWRGDVVLGCLLVVAGGLFVLMSVRPPTVIDVRGIRRPYRWRRRFITWPEVEAIVVPPTGLEPAVAPRVALRAGGRPVPLEDIAPDQAALVARIGDRPLRRPPVPGVLITPPPREKVRTDVDVEADVARRAAALERRWVALEAQNRQRPRSASRSAGDPSDGGEHHQ